MRPWSMLRTECEPDGALRDIYIYDATPEVWERVFSFLVASGDVRFEVDGVATRLPASASAVFEAGGAPAPCLVVRRAGIEYACHFFRESEVELDFPPEQISSQSAYDALVEFLAGLGRCTGRDVVVTHENMRKAEILRYVAKAGAVDVAENPGRRTRG